MRRRIPHVEAQRLVPAVGDRREAGIERRAQAGDRLRQRIAEVLVLPAPEPVPSPSRPGCGTAPSVRVERGERVALLRREQPLEDRAAVRVELAGRRGSQSRAPRARRLPPRGRQLDAPARRRSCRARSSTGLPLQQRALALDAPAVARRARRRSAPRDGTGSPPRAGSPRRRPPPPAPPWAPRCGRRSRRSSRSSRPGSPAAPARPAAGRPCPARRAAGPGRVPGASTNPTTFATSSSNSASPPISSARGKRSWSSRASASGSSPSKIAHTPAVAPWPPGSSPASIRRWRSGSRPWRRRRDSRSASCRARRPIRRRTARSSCSPIRRSPGHGGLLSELSADPLAPVRGRVARGVRPVSALNTRWKWKGLMPGLLGQRLQARCASARSRSGGRPRVTVAACCSSSDGWSGLHRLQGRKPAAPRPHRWRGTGRSPAAAGRDGAGWPAVHAGGPDRIEEGSVRRRVPGDHGGPPGITGRPGRALRLPG